MLERLGYPVELSFKSLFPDEGGNLNLLPAIVGPKKNFESWVGVAPFAAHKGKVYPTRLMRQVVDGLLQRHAHCRVFLFRPSTNGARRTTVASACQSILRQCSRN